VVAALATMHVAVAVAVAAYCQEQHRNPLARTR